MTTEAGGPVKFAVVDESTSASNALVAAVAGRKIRVLGGVLANNNASTDVVVTLEDSDGTNLLGPITLAAREKLVLPPNDYGYCEAPVAKALHMLQDGTENVAGGLTYQEVRVTV